jgi:hypothetical protein
MRTLSATLLAAQRKGLRLPYIEANVYDYEQGIKRLTWTRLYEGTEPDNHHGIAFDGQGSMHRICAAAGNLLYYQKVTSPGPTSDYSLWTQIATDCGGPCAIAACGAKVYIFYRTTGNVLWKYYSHDYGATWTGAQLAAYADVLSLAAAWWGTGYIIVCFALKSNELNGITINTSNQQTEQHPWSDGNHPLLDTCGIGATYDTSLNQCEIVLAGKESDSPYNHYDLFRTKLDDTYTFLALESFLMSPDGEAITYECPDCHLPASAQSCETNRIIVVEKFTGATAYTRPLTCHMVKGTYWSDSTFTEPRPFMDVAPCYGLRLTSDSSYWWLSMPCGVWRAARAAGSPLTLTTDSPTGPILSLTADGSQATALRITLDNSQAEYTPIPSGLRFRSEIVLKLGYKTTDGEETSEAGTYWVDGWEYSSTPNQSLFSIHCLDGRGLMDRWTARYQMRWNKDAVNPKSVRQILYQLLARAGIKLTNTPPKPQSSAINNFCPDFTINPGTQGTQAINTLLSFVPDHLVFRGQEAFTKDPLSTEESCYSYSPTTHVILSGAYREESGACRARAIGRDASGARILVESLDWNLVELATDTLEQDYDPNLHTVTRAQERADAILRQMSLRAERGNLVVPTNVGQELLDVVEVTDARCGISGENYRVEGVRTLYDHRKGIYDQRLALGAP